MNLNRRDKVLITSTVGKVGAAEGTKAGMDLNRRGKVLITTVGKGSAAESTRAGMARDTAGGVVMAVVVVTRPESLFTLMSITWSLPCKT